MGIKEFLKKEFIDKNFFKTYFSSSTKTAQENPYLNVSSGTYYEQFPSKNLYDEYSNIVDKHFKLNDEIQIKYSIAINQDTIFNDYAEQCKSLCLEDIKLAPILKEYIDKKAQLNKNKPFYPFYPSFSFLAKLYEKKNEIDSAILICIEAIKLGFTLDHSKAGMQGRLARLIKKHNQNSDKKLQFDYEKNILFDDETGEPLFNDKE